MGPNVPAQHDGDTSVAWVGPRLAAHRASAARGRAARRRAAQRGKRRSLPARASTADEARATFRLGTAVETYLEEMKAEIMSDMDQAVSALNGRIDSTIRDFAATQESVRTTQRRLCEEVNAHVKDDILELREEQNGIKADIKQKQQEAIEKIAAVEQRMQPQLPAQLSSVQSEFDNKLPHKNYIGQKQQEAIEHIADDLNLMNDIRRTQQEAIEKIAAVERHPELRSDEAMKEVSNTLQQMQDMEEKKNINALLNTGINDLEKEVAANTAALDETTAIRGKYSAGVNAEVQDLLESISALKSAITALSKHHGGSLVQLPAEAEALRSRGSMQSDGVKQKPISHGKDLSRPPWSRASALTVFSPAVRGDLNHDVNPVSTP